MNLREAIELMGVVGAVDASALDAELSGFAIDSRAVREGELFFALSPPDYERHSFTATAFGDAHEYIPQALSQGAVAVVARREAVAARPELQSERVRGRLLFADDVIDALQRLARGVLAGWSGTVVGITGSAGKTTTKDLTRQVLAFAGRRVIASRKNFNNELGVPLSVLQMESDGSRASDFDTAVIEMGMSMPGEIGKLAKVAPPDIGVELLVAPVHLEFVGSLERIAESKRELIEALKPEGIAILNADDERVLAMRASHAGRTILFGIEAEADVRATDVRTLASGGTQFELRTPLGSAIARLGIPGRHNISNALAAASVATCFGITPEVIAGALRYAEASEMRGQLIRFQEGFSVFDDCYNSNPRSLVAMARALVEACRETDGGRSIVVAGEMLELGDGAAEMHRAAGAEIARLKADRVLGVRGRAREIVRGAIEAGMDDAHAQFYETIDAAASALIELVRAGDWVLVKGSRGVHTEVIVAQLRAHFEEVAGDSG